MIKHNDLLTEIRDKNGNIISRKRIGKMQLVINNANQYFTEGGFSAEGFEKLQKDLKELATPNTWGENWRK